MKETLDTFKITLDQRLLTQKKCSCYAQEDTAMIYTIGYQSITIKQIEKIMDDKDIGLLVDVRSVPYSRRPDKYEFNKNRLIERFDERYVWMGYMCGGKSGMVKKLCIDKLIYLSSPPAERNLLLLCMEQHPCDCHRYYDIGKRLLNRGIDIVHLMQEEDGILIDWVRTSALEEVCNGRKKSD